MEYNKTQTTNIPPNEFKFAGKFADSFNVESRLNELLKLNSEKTNEELLFSTYQERVEAELIEFPIKTEKAFAWFGLMLGTFPPMAMFSKFIFQNLRSNDDIWIVALLTFVNLICGSVGYFSGKLIGKMVAEVEKYSWSVMLLLLPFIGILWGIMAGGAGGLFIFIIGAIFGAIIAAMVGGVALPIFTIFHRILKKGDVIDREHFIPLAFGITLIITAFIFGLPIR